MSKFCIGGRPWSNSSQARRQVQSTNSERMKSLARLRLDLEVEVDIESLIVLMRCGLVGVSSRSMRSCHWDVAGVLICLAGMAVIVLAPKSSASPPASKPQTPSKVTP